MKPNKVTELLEKMEGFTKKNSPAILSGLAIVGVFTTAVSAYKAGPLAKEIQRKKNQDMKDVDPKDKAAKRTVALEYVKEMTPVMLPTVISSAATVSCIVGSHTISNKRIAVLSAAYSLSETAVKDLNNKMNEMLGEKKTRSIKDAIVKDKLDKDGEKDREYLAENTFIMPGNDTVLCKDLYSGRLFYSNAEKIRQAIAKCSYEIVSCNYISLNDFYEEIDSKQLPAIPMGDDLGWNIDDCPSGKLPIYISAQLTEDGKPCLCVDYDINVRSDFRNLH